MLDADGAPVVDASGKPKMKRVGKTCPKLRNSSGWSSHHGTWHFQLEFTVAEVGRQVVARGGLASRAEAEEQLAVVRDLLRLADRVGAGSQEIGVLRVEIAKRIRQDLAGCGRLPSAEEVSRAIRAGQPLNGFVTVGQWLTDWLAGKSALSASTRRIYESHLRNYLIPTSATSGWTSCAPRKSPPCSPGSR
ncbi:hypothetical protein [Catenulispora sp. GAS73]|uniref:hypothetical protein n=1 Tax=Catenulispora sp. GAS73 TaxID=3156269 RepID=UPI00351951DA